MDDGVELYLEIDEARAASAYPGLTVVFMHGYALNLDCWHFQRQAFGGASAACGSTSAATVGPAGARKGRTTSTGWVRTSSR